MLFIVSFYIYFKSVNLICLEFVLIIQAVVVDLGSNYIRNS